MARPLVVVDAGDLTCAHTGKRGLTAPDTVKLTVGSSPAIPLTSVAGDAAYADCIFKDTNGVGHPCKSTTVTSKGAQKLTVGGTPVLLDSDAVNSVNDVPTTFPATVHPGQSKLSAS